MRPNTQDKGLLIFQASEDVLASLLFCRSYTNYNVVRGGRTLTHDKLVYFVCPVLPPVISFSPFLHTVPFNHTACALNVDTTCLTKHKIRTICFCSSQLEHAFKADECSIKDRASSLKSKSAEILARRLFPLFLPNSCIQPTPPPPLIN